MLDVHFQYVNPSLLSVKASFYGQLAELPHEFLLRRMVLLVRQYLSSLAELEKTGKMSIANGIEKKHRLLSNAIVLILAGRDY